MALSPSPKPERFVVAERYQILRNLGAGGIGTVYLARDAETDLLVALKLLRTTELDQEGLELLQAEFRSIAALRHPQIARAFDFGYAGESRRPFYTREYIEGSRLAPGPPPSSRAGSAARFLSPFFDLLDALEYLHAHEILHLDVHAGNLIVARDRRRGAVLIDCGVLRPLREPGGAAFVPLSSSVPPELLGSEPAGPPTDIYSVGRLLLYRLTGNPEGKPKLPQEIPGWGPRLTLELERILWKSVESDPAQRFPTAAAFREALASALGEKERKCEVAEPGEVTVGRDQELLAIDASLREAADGRSSVLWFVGPRGIGKSRLLGEARLRAQLRGSAVAEAAFYRDPSAEPRLVRSLRSAAGRRRSDHAWLVPLSTKEAAGVAEAATHAAAGFFESKGGPLAIILDDVENADRESRLLAEALVSEAGRRQAAASTGRGMAVFAATTERPSLAGLPPSLQRRAVRALTPLRGAHAMELLAKLLRPRQAPRPLLERVAREAKGSPLRLRLLARALNEECPLSEGFPLEPDIQDHLVRRLRSGRPLPALTDPSQLAILRALAVLERGASSKEITAAAAVPRHKVVASIRRLREAEVLAQYPRGRGRVYSFASPVAVKEMAARATDEDKRAVHRRMVKFLRAARPDDPRSLENLGRHLLALGHTREARQVAMKAARVLRGRGLLQNAARLLSEAASSESNPTWRLRLVEEVSSLLEQLGDHQEGIDLLEPAHRGELGPLKRSAAVRVRRRLGVHYHRAGLVEGALAVFAEARRMAHPDRDAEELVRIDSELTELYTLRAEHGQAEKACRRGLRLVAKAGRLEFRRRMEVTLRASLGHLELRRMALARARKELETAARLARLHGTATSQALILNNLGVVHHQLNDFARARTCLRRAERLFTRTGERRGVVHINCNLATIAAKTGDAAGALEYLEKARHLVRHYPAKRLDFAVSLTHGIVAHSMGDVAASSSAFRCAIPLGRALGDSQFVGFAEVYLAEAHIACGRYAEALERLRDAAVEARATRTPLLERAVQTRLLFVEEILGRRRAAGKARSAIGAVERTDVLLVETWNDVFLALSAFLASEEQDTARAADLLKGAFDVFRRLGVPAGARLARVGLLFRSLERGDAQGLRAGLGWITSAGSTPHKLLSVLEPLACAEACLHLGDPEKAERFLNDATSAIVGMPFLELDWRIEFLRALLAERRSDVEGARRHLHRSNHTRELLARSLPVRLRRRFLEHPRFSALSSHAARLEGPRPTPVHPGGGARRGFHGLVGRTPVMIRTFETIEQLAPQKIPVLIVGETGTGKELVARAIHEIGPRRRGPFLAVHCASLPPELFESELFGHERGAFTGADEARAGLLEHLAGGTLLLDEVASLSLETQAKVLRVLDTGIVRPLGSLRTRLVDVRFLASSGSDLTAAVRAGTFRPDLYYRLRGAEVRLPPLRARDEDIPLLVEHFVSLHAERLERAPLPLTRAALEVLQEHEWRGNVRELEALLLRLLVTSTPGVPVGSAAVRALLPQEAGAGLFSEDLVAGRDLKKLRRELERTYLVRLFKETRGDIPRMAAALGVKTSRVYGWIRDVGLDIGALRRSL